MENRSCATLCLPNEFAISALYCLLSIAHIVNYPAIDILNFFIMLSVLFVLFLFCLSVVLLFIYVLFVLFICFICFLFRVGSLDVGVGPNSPARQTLPARVIRDNPSGTRG